SPGGPTRASPGQSARRANAPSRNSKTDSATTRSSRRRDATGLVAALPASAAGDAGSNSAGLRSGPGAPRDASAPRRGRRRRLDPRGTALARGRLPRTRRPRRGSDHMSLQRIGAVMQKETREYRRNRLIVVTMAVTPLVLLIVPLVAFLRAPASVSDATV